MEVQYMSFHKRKRSVEDVSSIHITDIKRRHITALPIRSSPPTRPSISVTPAFAAFARPAQQTPTPTSTSEDETYSPQQVWMQRSRSANALPTNSTPFTVPTRTDSKDDVNMFPSSPSPSISRARSNALMSPQRYLGINSPSPFADVARERVPTPITSTFAPNDYVSRPTPGLRTVLSPMIDEEVWTRSGGLLSPTEEGDGDCKMAVDEANDFMTGMRLGSEEADMTYIREAADGLDGFGDATPGSMGHRPRLGLVNLGPDIHDHNSRSARLHMGFRADCDKCLQRVPGHYSHIIWS